MVLYTVLRNFLFDEIDAGGDQKHTILLQWPKQRSQTPRFTYSMRNALAMKIVFRTVSQMQLTFETVATLKMLVSDV